MSKSVTLIAKKLYMDRKPHSNEELYDAIDRKFINDPSYNAKELYHQARAVQQHLKNAGKLKNTGYSTWQMVV